MSSDESGSTLVHNLVDHFIFFLMIDEWMLVYGHMPFPPSDNWKRFRVFFSIENAVFAVFTGV